MVWPWTLNFWHKNVIRSSVSQDAPVTKVWRKSVDRYWKYRRRGNIKFSGAFGHAATLTFDLLTPNLISSSLSRDAPVTKVWRKSVNRYWRYRGNIKLPREARTHGRRHGRTTRKHIASADAYRRRRLKMRVWSVNTLSYQPVAQISPNTWWCSWGYGWTDSILKVEGSRSRS